MRTALFFLMMVFVISAASGRAEEPPAEDFDAWAAQFESSLDAPQVQQPPDAEERKASPSQSVRVQAEETPPLPKIVGTSLKGRTDAIVPELANEENMVETDLADKGDLVSLDTSQNKSEIQRLERRLSMLERDMQFMEDRVQSLTRTVSDLRRKR